MKTVKMDKKALRVAVEANKAKHRTIFLEALEGWKKEVLKEVESLYEAAKKDRLPKIVMVHLPRPEDHTRDYDRALQMIDAEVGDTVILTEEDFARLVQNDWSWARAFLTSNSRYSGTARQELGQDEDYGAFG